MTSSDALKSIIRIKDGLRYGYFIEKTGPKEKEVCLSVTGKNGQIHRTSFII